MNDHYYGQVEPTNEDLTDELIQDAINDQDPPLSNCCGMPFYRESDICGSCNEHAVSEVRGFKFPANDEHSFLITFNPIDLSLISFHNEEPS